jgi:RimJ/RimL family protein N-acetyltransferase
MITQSAQGAPVVARKEKAASKIAAGGFIRIRPFATEDVEPLYEAVRESVKQLCHWMVWCHANYSIEDSRSFVWSSERDWDRADRYSFVIEDTRDGSLVGSVGLSSIVSAHRFANLGYWVRTSRTRQGIARAAVVLAAGFAFERLGLERLELIIPVSNEASRRVAERAGAHCEGLLRKRLVLRGKLHDAALYSLLPEDL